MAYDIIIRTKLGEILVESVADLNTAETRCKTINSEGVVVAKTSNIVPNTTHIYFPPHGVHYIYLRTS